MDKILITGISDFLGINLANILLNDENNVVFGIDNISQNSFSNLYSLLKNNRFNLLEWNNEAVINHTCNFIFHLMPLCDLKYYLNDKYSFCTGQFETLTNILNYTKLSGAKLIIAIPFCDFSEENKELFDYFNFINFIVGLALNFADINKIYIRFARLGEIYGHNCPKDDLRFIPQSIIKAFSNINIELDYNKSAYFTFVSDIVSALKNFTSNYTEEKLIDISSTKQFLYTDIIKLILNLTKSNSKIIIKNEKIIYPTYTPDLKSAIEELKADFSVSVEEGISKTVDFIKLMYFS